MDELPELKGSQAQIEWAEIIRIKKISEGNRIINEYRNKTEHLAVYMGPEIVATRKAVLGRMIDAFERIKSRMVYASDWIANKDEPMGEIIATRMSV